MSNDHTHALHKLYDIIFGFNGLAIHDLDIINHLLGEDPLYVSAVTGQIRHKYEDYANINLTYNRDRNAFVETNWLTPRRVRTLTITGTEGIINVEYTTQQITVENEERITQPPHLLEEVDHTGTRDRPPAQHLVHPQPHRAAVGALRAASDDLHRLQLPALQNCV